MSDGAGEVVYRAKLADGRQSIALFTPDLFFKSGTGNDLFDSQVIWTLGTFRHAVAEAELRCERSEAS